MNLPEHPGLSPAARALLRQRAASGAPPSAPAIEGPLTEPQLSQWLFARLHPESNAFHLDKRITLHGPLDQEHLQRALDALVDRHVALRTTFHLLGDQPMQRVQPAGPILLTVRDLTALPEAIREEQVAAICEAFTSQPFDLTADLMIRALLLKTGADRWTLQLTFHHIAFDGWSTGILLADLEELYAAARDGRPSSLAAVEAGIVQVQDREAVTARSANPPESALDLPVDHPITGKRRHLIASCSRRIPAEVWNGVASLARAEGAPAFAVASAALAVLVSRRAGQRRAVLGMLSAGRTEAEWERRIGNFVTQLALPIDLHGEATFGDVVTQARERIAVALTDAGRDDSRTEFPVTLNFRNLPWHQPRTLFGCELARFDSFQPGGLSTLHFELTPGDIGATLRLDYDADLIEGKTAEWWIDAYLAILDAAVARPEIAWHALPIAGNTELELLARWNATEGPHSPGATLASLFAAQAARTPDFIAVSAMDESWTYHELDREACRIAALLRQRGIGPGAIVGLCQERSLGLVASMVGTTLSGAAYLPLDPTYPANRLHGMLQDAAVSVVLTGQGTPAALSAIGVELLPWDATEEVRHTAPALPNSRDPAYVLFTSGSTGRPKGVVIPHSAIVNHIEWMRDAFPMTAADGVLQKTSISFDASVWEFWAPLLSDARLVLAPPESERDPAALLELVRTNQITILQLVPGMLRAILEDGGLPSATSLRLVCVGGEALTWDLVTAFHQQHSAVLVNLYGPTETTIDATFWVADLHDAAGPVPIGRPISNGRIHVIDDRGTVVPIGVPGEICVAGAGVGTGYLHQPELTRERFVPEPGRPDNRMYRTGDLGRWRFDGVIEFHGRVDHQVKFRGFRIELEEIDVVLMAHPAVSRAITVVHRDARGNERLVTYLAASRERGTDDELLRQHLRASLPEQMVPAHFVRLDALPLTASGKVDRQALPAPDLATAPPVTEPASGPVETTLAACWQELLPTPGLGRHTSFLDAGGHSLLAVRFLASVHRALGTSVTLAQFLERPTIATVAGLLAQPATDVRSPIVAQPRRKPRA